MSWVTDMQILECATAHRRAYTYARSVIEYQLSRTIDCSGASILENVRQLIIGKLDTLEDILGIFTGVGNDTGCRVGAEQAFVQKEEAKECSNP